jgi:predicted TIM-barrel fold metal-dependent hydrolase
VHRCGSVWAYGNDCTGQRECKHFKSIVGPNLVLCESILDENKILFGTGHPFLDNAERGAIEYINRAKVTDQQREKVYSKDAAALFKLKA